MHFNYHFLYKFSISLKFLFTIKTFLISMILLIDYPVAVYLYQNLDIFIFFIIPHQFKDKNNLNILPKLISNYMILWS